MAISTLDQYVASARQNLTLMKTATRTTVATGWFSLMDIAGNPGAGTLAGTSTTTGVVPTDATAGCPIINFSSGKGYLTGVDFGNTVACRMMVADLMWKGGAYAFNASTAGNTPSSYSSRITGSDYTGCQIWLEQVTASTGVQKVAVTYTNQDGVTGRSTGTFATAANTVGRMWQIPLQSGDSGVQAITGVVGSTATAGTFNILVLRPLWYGRCRLANDGDSHALDKTGMPIVYPDSALQLYVCADSTSSGIPELMLEIASA